MTTADDPDQVDRSRAADLGDVGLPGYCVAVTVTPMGEERFALLRFNAGEADYWPTDWALIAPHELIGLPVYEKE